MFHGDSCSRSRDGTHGGSNPEEDAFDEVEVEFADDDDGDESAGRGSSDLRRSIGIANDHCE